MIKFLKIFNEIPLEKIFLLLGIIFIFSSYIQYNKEFIFSNNVNCLRLSIGLFFISLFIISWIYSMFVQINRKKITTKGKRYKYKDVEILLQIGRIEDKNLYTENSVVVLPANTSFDDDCIIDKRSALGSFFTTHYINQLGKVKETIILTVEQECRKINENEFELGSTILLPAPFDNLTKVAVSAVTTRYPKDGISANLCAIALTIKNIFEITSDKKIDSLILPVLGSGHGGLEIDSSLNSMLFNIKYYIHYYHHIKNVKIIIYN
jgi:hypothetical protein